MGASAGWLFLQDYPPDYLPLESTTEELNSNEGHLQRIPFGEFPPEDLISQKKSLFMFIFYQYYKPWH